MPLTKVINKGQNGNLIGGDFTNAASETVFNLGTFNVTTNLEKRIVRDYSNQLSRFVKPITLETINLTNDESINIHSFVDNVQLNIDKSNLLVYARFGSLSELFRVSLSNIILAYPASLYVNYFRSAGSTLTGLSFDSVNNVSSFTIQTAAIDNRFGIIYRGDNFEILDSNPLSNLNFSFSEYVIWNSNDYENNSHEIIGFTGQTIANNIKIKCVGNPFPTISGSSARISFHIKPKPIWFNKFKKNLSDIESFLIEKRDDVKGFVVQLKTPIVLEDGGIDYSFNDYIWPTTDGYNVDTDSTTYLRYVDSLSQLGITYDQTKTDLLFRFLTPKSIKDYDQTDQQKISKLLRIYGKEFDQLKLYIDAISNVYNVSYNKSKNVPDVLVKNFARTLGWDVFSLVGENDLIESFFSTDEISIRDNQMLPTDIDIELWRRILINSTYYLRSKGTRASLKSMLLMLGIPDPFINITEYVYTVDGIINPDAVELSIEDLPSASFPFNSAGYPITPKETNDFYFQISGDTDSGQAYIDVFRQVGFSVNRTVDNKKSWIEAGNVDRAHYTTPTYHQRDSKLIINTKEIDATLDTSRGVEYDVYQFNSVQNFPLISTGVTQAYVYINIPFTFGSNTNVFTIPEPAQGVIQVNFNGITLALGTGATNGDYMMTSSSSVVLNFGNFAEKLSNGQSDVVTLTYMHDRLGTYISNLINYAIIRPTVTAGGTILQLPEEPNGDVQLTVDGISMTKGTSLFTGDYIISSIDRTKLIITNTSLQNYLLQFPVVTVSYFTAAISDVGNLYKETEVYLVDSLFTSKVYYNAMILKTVYVLNYAALNIDSIKVTINGLTLQNGVDFTINSGNKKEIYFNDEIKLSDVIAVYYVLTDYGVLKSEIMTVSTPVSQMTFLEYIELITTRLINAKNRKIVTDNNGGFYPTLFKVYEDYYRFSFLPEGNFQKSNGYSFANLFAFTNQFNVAFQKFLKQLLSATVIIRKGGFLIRNTVFTKQKFTYKRGLNFNPLLNWFGDDGSEFKSLVMDSTQGFGWSGFTCAQDDFCNLIVDNVHLISEYNPSLITTTTTTTTSTTTLVPQYMFDASITFNNDSGNIINDTVTDFSNDRTVVYDINITSPSSPPIGTLVRLFFSLSGHLIANGFGSVARNTVSVNGTTYQTDIEGVSVFDVVLEYGSVNQISISAGGTVLKSVATPSVTAIASVELLNGNVVAGNGTVVIDIAHQDSSVITVLI